MAEDPFLAFLADSHSYSSQESLASFEGPVCVCIGNEAGDADSHVSALALAYYLSKAHPGDGVRYVGVSSIPRGDLPLQLDRHHLLKSAGMAGEGDGLRWRPTHVRFSGEVDLASLHEQKRLQLSLVDHNQLCAGLSQLGGAVTRIIDHHQDKGAHAHVTGDDRSVRFGVGSCCSQVAQLLYDGGVAVTPPLARLLLGVVLLDTVNLQPEKKPQEAWEKGVAERLHSDSALPASPAAYWEELTAAKNNSALMLRDFTNAMFLRQDYKCERVEVAGRADPVVIGASSMSGVCLEQLVERGVGQLAADVAASLAEQELDVLALVVLTADAKRQLALLCKDPARTADLVRHLNDGGLDLSENEPCNEALKAVGGGPLLFLNQGNARASRKVVLPLLADAKTGFATKL
eukprot:TRINITY_DN4624_c3_g1_i2.p1 TRINITY_DN4624_c3_g1~~TRINITY_DN4624_c3_g1_i2.p1  ORF type:complete len:432 (+),score=173.10 TRINITY_DN4624_c3_g1_i2:85-1296(+)